MLPTSGANSSWGWLKLGHVWMSARLVFGGRPVRGVEIHSKERTFVTSTGRSKVPNVSGVQQSRSNQGAFFGTERISKAPAASGEYLPQN